MIPLKTNQACRGVVFEDKGTPRILIAAVVTGTKATVRGGVKVLFARFTTAFDGPLSIFGGCFLCTVNVESCFLFSCSFCTRG